MGSVRVDVISPMGVCGSDGWATLRFSVDNDAVMSYLAGLPSDGLAHDSPCMGSLRAAPPSPAAAGDGTPEKKSSLLIPLIAAGGALLLVVTGVVVWRLRASSSASAAAGAAGPQSRPSMFSAQSPGDTEVSLLPKGGADGGARYTYRFDPTAKGSTRETLRKLTSDRQTAFNDDEFEVL